MEQLNFTDRFNIPNYFNPHHLFMATLEFSGDKCLRCSLCTTICPGRCIAMERVKAKAKKDKPLPYLVDIVPDITGCIGCGCCAAACPEGAIEVTASFRPTRFYTHVHQTSEMTFPHKY